jgi:hypothetical protein
MVTYFLLLDVFKMSERDLERLGNNPFREIKVPEYFLEGSKSTVKPPRISLKELEPELPKNTARLHDFTEKTRLGRISFSDELILPEENGSDAFWFTDAKYKGVLLFCLYSLEWPIGRGRLKNKKAFPIHLEPIREWGIKPGLYYAQRNNEPKLNVECQYDRFCYSKIENGICKRGGCWYRSNHFNDKEVIWHVGIGFLSKKY